MFQAGPHQKHTSLWCLNKCELTKFKKTTVGKITGYIYPCYGNKMISLLPLTLPAMINCVGMQINENKWKVKSAAAAQAKLLASL